ncbi:MAG: EAL domain-containing protein [Thiohalomonadales bacterium]
MSPPKLIVIDDEVDLANFVSNVAEQNGYVVEIFNSGKLFINEYHNQANVIILDIMMPEIDGIELIRFLAGENCVAQIVLISGFDSGVLYSAKKLANEQGLNIAGTLSKPFRFDEIHKLLKGLPIIQTSIPIHKSTQQISVEELQNAINSNELVTYYQPQVTINDYTKLSVEALVRWQHPEKGLLGPDLFIPMAEQYDLIDGLTWVVLKQVMAQCQAWAKLGLTVQVAINMSAQTLQDLNLPIKLGDLVKRYNLQASQFILEVTESALMTELIKSLEILTRLRMKGFSLSIDDFGTGYSSLIQLNRIPFSELKIDKSFVINMKNEPEALAIVETVILLGNKLGMDIVAEGVENKDNLESLSNLGCTIAQGYYISKPISGDKITNWLLNKVGSQNIKKI